MPTKISFDRIKIEEFCRRWRIRELSLFGSILRDDFRDDSDVDVLATYQPEADWGLLDHITMQDELAAVIGRKVDLISRRAVERSSNRIRRDSILNVAQVLHAAR